MNAFEQEHATSFELGQPTNKQLQDINTSQVLGRNSPDGGNLDKVRDILFGPQMRDYEKRFTRLEERLIKECSNLREDTRKRIDSLESYIKTEVDSLMQRLKTEQTQRDDSMSELDRELKNLIKSLERKITQLDEQTSQSQRDLRQQILDQSKNLDNDIRQKYEEILTVLEREAKELRTDKTDRSTLAALFAELAVRLNDESGSFDNS
jgi:DNA repair exonuclease SbcCD ATPase subunit